MPDGVVIMTLEELRETLGPGAFEDLRLGVVCEAEHDANVMVSGLSTPSARKRRRPDVQYPGRTKSHPIIILAAMLPRIQRWFNDGDVCYFARRPPDPAVVIDLLGRLGRSPIKNEDVALCRKLTVETLVCWMQHCSWSARRTIGAEIVLRTPSALLAHVDDLADYLGAHRGLVTEKKGNDDADS